MTRASFAPAFARVAECARAGRRVGGSLWGVNARTGPPRKSVQTESKAHDSFFMFQFLGVQHGREHQTGMNLNDMNNRCSRVMFKKMGL